MLTHLAKIFLYRQLTQAAFNCTKLTIDHQNKVCDTLKVNNKDTKITSCRRSGVFVVNFEAISHLSLGFYY